MMGVSGVRSSWLKGGEEAVLGIGAGAGDLAIASECVARLFGFATFPFEPFSLGDVDERGEKDAGLVIVSTVPPRHELKVSCRPCPFERQLHRRTRPANVPALSEVLGEARFVRVGDE
jgi:hypothetical protein